MLMKLLIGYLMIGTIWTIVAIVIYRFVCKGITISNRLFIISRLFIMFLWPIELISIVMTITGHNKFFEMGIDICKQSGDYKDEEDS